MKFDTALVGMGGGPPPPRRGVSASPFSELREPFLMRLKTEYRSCFVVSLIFFLGFFPRQISGLRLLQTRRSLDKIN